MFEIEALDVSHWITRYIYPFARISGLLMVMPLIGTRMVSQRIRLLLAVAITFVVVPILPPIPHVEAISLASFIIVLQQLLIGIVMGFVIELLMQVFVIAGQLIAMQTGLGIATTVDPSQGASVVVISQWFLFFIVAHAFDIQSTSICTSPAPLLDVLRLYIMALITMTYSPLFLI